MKLLNMLNQFTSDETRPVESVSGRVTKKQQRVDCVTSTVRSFIGSLVDHAYNMCVRRTDSTVSDEIVAALHVA
jgi:hypothetical protein